MHRPTRRSVPLPDPGLGAIAALALALALACQGAAEAADDEPPDPEDLRPGLIVSYRPDGDAAGADLPPIRRTTSALVGRWGDGAPDPRLPAGAFSASWSGWLLVREPGPHRFRVDSDGLAELRVGERSVLAEGGGPARSGPIDLGVGLHPLRLDYERGAGSARVGVDWEGPGFGPEHIPTHQLYHEADQAPPEDLFERGRRLADRLGCANCHEVLGMPGHLGLGPPLDASAEIEPGWLVDWIVDPASTRPGTAMPGFGLDRRQAADLAAFLAGASARAAEPDREASMARNVADVGRGRLLFRSAGCLGCHASPAGDEPGPIRTAPDLAGLGRKRSAEAVADDLGGATRRDPGRHRPELGLSAEAAAHLAAYLTADDHRPPSDPIEGDPHRGRELAGSIGCVSCHAIPGVERGPATRPLSAGADPEAGCLADEPPAGIPRYRFDGPQHGALRAFVGGLPSDPSPLPPWSLAEDAIRRHNCLGCHSRSGVGGEGLGAELARLLAEDRELNTLKGTLTPPDLSSVGAKLRPEYLDLAVRGEAPTARPWLSVRMPRFAFEPGEAEAIVSHLRDSDRVDDPVIGREGSPTLGKEIGVTLLGRDGFGCVSCHVLDGKVPPGGEAETLGPDLALAHRRMTRPYYERWLADPQRIIPGTPMPQFLTPAPGVGGALAEQLGAVWEALGDARLAELASTASRQFLERRGGRALVVRDMVVVPDAPEEFYPRGLAIGLEGDRSLLFDADRLGWIRWWDGGFLYRTKQGRLWEWHPEGRALWVAGEALPPVAFGDPDGRFAPPEERRGRFGSFSELAFEGDGVLLEYVVAGPGEASVRVSERIDPTDDGWERLVRFEDVPAGVVPAVVVGPGATADDRGRRSWVSGGTRVELRGIRPDDLFEAPLGRATTDALLARVEPDPRGRWSCRIRVVLRPEE